MTKINFIIYLLNLTDFLAVMLSETKHLALEQALYTIADVRFFAEPVLERSEGLRMTWCVYFC
jgi:hypothetical protein